MTSMSDNKEIEKIVLDYILKVGQLEVDTGEVLRERAEDLVTRVLLRINENLKNLDHVKKYDGMYYLTEAMKEDYESFMKALDEGGDRISDPTVQKLFGGMGEMALAALANMPSRNDNPITYERMVLISGAILKVKRYYSRAMDCELKTGGLGDDISADNMRAFIGQQVTSFLEATMAGVLAILEDTISLLSAFSEGKKYLRFVEEQVTHLSTLAIRQKELVMAHLETEAEKSLVTDLLDRLTHIHDVSKTAIADLAAETDGVGDSGCIINHDQIESIMNAHGVDDMKSVKALMNICKSLRENSVGGLQRIIGNFLEYRHLEVSKQMTKESAEFQKLSGQMVSLFSETVAELETTPDTYGTDQGKAIVRGIKATMALKLASFREKDTEYQLGNKHKTIELEQVILEAKEVVVNASDPLLMAMVAGNQAMLPMVEGQFNDKLDQVREGLFRYDINYLRHDLLFELKTFEELIEHSLRKLIELESEKAKEIADILLGTLEGSRTILSAHGIDLIIPKPHDKFAGKYHEVMLADQEDGFVKGEVVKTIHIGYQLKKQVIIRASVLAAR